MSPEEAERQAQQASRIVELTVLLATMPEGPGRQALEAELARLQQIVSARENRGFAAGMLRARPRQ